MEPHMAAAGMGCDAGINWNNKQECGRCVTHNLLVPAVQQPASVISVSDFMKPDEAATFAGSRCSSDVVDVWPCLMRRM